MVRLQALRPVLRAAGWLLLTILAIPLLYVSAAAVGAAIPGNPGWREAERGVTIYVRSNGIHTDIVMPARAAGTDWLPLLPPAHVKRPELADGWVAVGAGERAFYLETPRWSDLKPATALKAAWGGDILLHVEHLPEPWPDQDSRPVTLSPDEYRRLARAIRSHFRPDPAGRTIPLLGRGYFEYDVFYEAVGRYDGFATCNQWTGRMLREAGVKVGRWTPLPWNLMWRFKEG